MKAQKTLIKTEPEVPRFPTRAEVLCSSPHNFIAPASKKKFVAHLPPSLPPLCKSLNSLLHFAIVNTHCDTSNL